LQAAYERNSIEVANGQKRFMPFDATGSRCREHATEMPRVIREFADQKNAPSALWLQRVARISTRIPASRKMILLHSLPSPWPA
jgi:hypothetical protein